VRNLLRTGEPKRRVRNLLRTGELVGNELPTLRFFRA